eukprot:5491627-Prymnesium_polylepis.1
MGLSIGAAAQMALLLSSGTTASAVAVSDAYFEALGGHLQSNGGFAGLNSAAALQAVATDSIDRLLASQGVVASASGALGTSKLAAIGTSLHTSFDSL